MPDVSKYPGLYKRGDVYWHRVFIPKDLWDTYPGKGDKPRKEIPASLDTKNRAEGISRAKQRDADFDREFAEKRRSLNGKADVLPPPATTLSPTDRRRLADAHYSARTADEPLRRRNLLKQARADEDAFWRGDLVPVPVDTVTMRGVPYSYWNDVCPDLPLEDAILYAVGFDNRKRMKSLERAVRLGDCDGFLPHARALALNLVALRPKNARWRSSRALKQTCSDVP